MGAACSLDASPLSIDEVIGFVAPPGAPPPAAHRSNLKVWRFFTTQGATDVGSAPLSLAGFAGFSAAECYVLLHVYRRRDGTTTNATDEGASVATTRRFLSRSVHPCIPRSNLHDDASIALPILVQPDLPRPVLS